MHNFFASKINARFATKTVKISIQKIKSYVNRFYVNTFPLSREFRMIAGTPIITLKTRPIKGAMKYPFNDLVRCLNSIIEAKRGMKNPQYANH